MLGFILYLLVIGVIAGLLGAAVGAWTQADGVGLTTVVLAPFGVHRQEFLGDAVRCGLR